MRKLVEMLEDRLLNRKKELYDKNLKNLLDKSFDTRIQNKYKEWCNSDVFASAFMSFEDFKKHVISKIQEGDICYTMFFAKSVSRQNIWEGCQIEELCDELEKYGIKLDVKKISNRSYFIDQNGEVVDKRPSGSVKSLDLVASYNDYKIVGTCKYINGAGGAQDNQYNDIIASNERFVKNKNPKVLTISLCDGSYFNKKKQDILKNYNTELNFAGSTTEVIEWLKIKLKN